MNTQLNNVTNKGDPNSLYIQHCYIQDVCPSHYSFLAQLFSHDDFQKIVQQIWNSEFGSINSTLQDYIDGLANNAQKSVVLNSFRWGIFGRDSNSSVIGAYNSKVNYVKDFIAKRYTYLSFAYSDDSYFVKYDVGDNGKLLVQDTNIYASGDTAKVKSGAKSKDSNLVFDYWSMNPDGSGTQYHVGDTIIIRKNIHLYAQWKTK